MTPRGTLESDHSPALMRTLQMLDKRNDQRVLLDRTLRRVRRITGWLSAPSVERDEPIHHELLCTLSGHSEAVIFGAISVMMMPIAYAVLQDAPVGLLLSVALLCGACLRLFASRRSVLSRAAENWDARDVITSALVWTGLAGISGALCAASGQTVLLVLSSCVVTGLAFGAIFNNAALPRFAKTQITVIILPFLAAAGFSPVPHMRWILLQAPLWLGGTFFLVDRAYRDSADLIHARQRVTFLALNDQLTGLPNRARILADLACACALSKQDSAPAFYVLCLDLDGFKEVNDRFGHGAGDELLCAVAERLLHSVRTVDLVGRMGGDEFVALLKDLNHDQVEKVAWRMVGCLAEPFQLAVAKDIRIGVSIGGAPLDGNDITDVLAKADDLLYAAKRAGKGTLRLVPKPQLGTAPYGERYEERAEAAY